ncbi:sortase [Ruminococcus sp. Marseille-P6503]|uniref:sortase n=1 Tax=Ruminococcus sp. Marseille-P6503 TaxID=2364796 RepID=UPI000F5295ED|nr:sortase [Ruminococcus sp. Marseille-P6503]
MAERNAKGRFLIAAGTVLLLAALSLVLWNGYRERRSENSMTAVLSELKKEISEGSSDGSVSSDEGAGDKSGVVSPEKDYIEIDGKLYIGYISIPSIEAELPVMDEWSYDNLNIAPCRYSGSLAAGDMVIAAHNYKNFFSRLDELNSGDEVIFTTASGIEHRFQVIQTDIVNGTDIDAMLSGSEEWDLTLFTCTWSGWSRVAVRTAAE